MSMSSTVNKTLFASSTTIVHKQYDSLSYFHVVVSIGELNLPEGPFRTPPHSVSSLKTKTYTIDKQCTVKPFLSSHLKKQTKIGYQDSLSLYAGQTYCRMTQGYFRPSLSYHLSLRPLFDLFSSGVLRQVAA